MHAGTPASVWAGVSRPGGALVASRRAALDFNLMNPLGRPRLSPRFPQRYGCTVAVVICNGCQQPIDPAFDATTHDGEGREWHTTCWIAKVGAHDKGDDVDYASASPVLWLGYKAFKRLKRAR